MLMDVSDYDTMKGLGLLAVTVLFALVWVYTPHKDRPCSLDGQCILLTGAAGGLGESIAREIYQKATRVSLILLDVNYAALERLKADIEFTESDNSILIYQCDVSDEDAVSAVVAKANSELSSGHISVLINNAGVVAGGTLMDLTTTQIRRTFGVNILAHFWLTKALLPSMKKHRRGHVISISSVMGSLSSACLTEYCASKAAVNNFNDCLRAELRREGYHDCIRTLVVQPSVIDTSMFEGAFENQAWTSFGTKLMVLQLRSRDVARSIVHSIENGDDRLAYCSGGWRDWVFHPGVAILRMLPTMVYDVAIATCGGLDGMDSYLQKHASE